HLRVESSPPSRRSRKEKSRRQAELQLLDPALESRGNLGQLERPQVVQGMAAGAGQDAEADRSLPGRRVREGDPVRCVLGQVEARHAAPFSPWRSEPQRLASAYPVGIDSSNTESISDSSPKPSARGSG